MLRRLLWALLALVTWMLVNRLLRRASRRGAAPASSPLPPRFEGAMVRDRVCETFVPRARALRLTRDGTEHFFCSEGCRSRFLERVRAAR